jgi:hypothetical protein
MDIAPVVFHSKRILKNVEFERPLPSPPAPLPKGEGRNAEKCPHHHDREAAVVRRSMLRTLENYFRAVDRSD